MTDSYMPEEESPILQANQGRARGGLFVLLSAFVAGVVLLSLMVVGSVVGEWVRAPGWMVLGAGLVAVGVPLALKGWLHHLTGPTRRAPRFVTLFVLVNVFLLVVLMGLARERTGLALRARGDFGVVWVANAMGLRPDHVLRRAGTTWAHWLAARVLPHGTELARAKEQPAEGVKPLAESPPSDSGLASRLDVDAASQRVVPAADGLTRVGAEVDPHRTETHRTETQPRAVSMGTTRVAFERQGRAIIVPVKLFGPHLEVNVQMMFDTGATFTTIDSRTLANLGLYVGSGDPTVTLHTASGTAQRTITVIEAIEVAGARVDGGLTVALCDECSDGNAVGLLGLNYARHFRVTVDHSAGELQLERTIPDADQLYDIRPFIRLSEIKGVQQGDQLSIQLWLENRSPRLLRDMRLSAEAGGSSAARLTREVAEVAPGRVKLELQGNVPTSADGFRVEVERANWSGVTRQPK